MNEIPSVTFQIISPSKGVAGGSVHGLWFKVKSDPSPTDKLVVCLKVCPSNGNIRQSDVIVIPKHDNHSAEFFYKRKIVVGLDFWEILIMVPCLLIGLSPAWFAFTKSTRVRWMLALDGGLLDFCLYLVISRDG